MSLRRPLLIRWSPYAEECIEILSTSPDAAPTDRWLCLLVHGQHITEDIGFEFSMDDPASQLSLTDHKTQYHLKAFERHLAEWEGSATPDMLKKPIMKTHQGHYQPLHARDSHASQPQYRRLPAPFQRRTY